MPDTVNFPCIGRIPVRNIFLLIWYASEMYQDFPRSRNLAVEDAPDDLPNLVARFLSDAVERRMRRDLSFGYRRHRADLDRVRGRIDLLRTERRQLLQRGEVACAFDDMTIDTPLNRFAKAALSLLGRIVSDHDLSHRCRILGLMMENSGVGDSPHPYRGQYPMSPRLGRLSPDDRQILHAAILAFNLALPTQDAGSYLLAAPSGEPKMAELFERAIGGFYEHHLSGQGWRVHRHQNYRRWIQWRVDDGSPHIRELIPSMQRDIVLVRPSSKEWAGGHQIVIDTKFMPILTRGYSGGRRFKSDHLYQLYAYLRSQERDGDARSLDSDGILLYPSVGEDFNEWAVIQGHRIRFATVDLAADSAEIRQRLLQIVGASVQ